MLWMGDIVLLSQRHAFVQFTQYGGGFSHHLWWLQYLSHYLIIWISCEYGLICQIVLFIIIHLFLPYYVHWLVWLWFWHFFKLIRYIDWLWLIIDFCHLIWLDWLWNCFRHFNKWQFSIHTIPIMSSINHQTKHNIKKLGHKDTFISYKLFYGTFL